MQYLQDHHFDTESMDLDLQINNGIGNISQYINKKDCIDGVTYIFNQSRRMFHCWSVCFH